MTLAYGASDSVLAVAGYQWSFFGSLFIVPFLCWTYMELTGTHRIVKVVFLAVTLTVAVLTLIDFWSGGFYYASFQPTPWGNRGIENLNRDQWLANTVPFIALIELGFGVGWLLVSRKKASAKLRHQIRWILPGIAVTGALYMLAWLLELTIHIPNAMVLAPSVMVGVTLYLVSRYRYLRSDTPLLEEHFVQVAQSAAVLADAQARIAGANPAAQTWLQRSEESLLGQDLFLLFDDPTALRREWHQASHRQTLHQRLPIRVSQKLALISLKPHFDRYGDFTGAVLVAGSWPLLDERSEEWGLTLREQEILALLLEGASHQDIADRLAISPATAKLHSHHLLEKAGASNRAELFAFLLSP
jgi:DNA-binding CsgD family transcriptional regulator